jgi:hypothetical protein
VSTEALARGKFVEVRAADFKTPEVVVPKTPK